MLRTFPLSPSPLILRRFYYVSAPSHTFLLFPHLPFIPRTSIIPSVHSALIRLPYAFAGHHCYPYCSCLTVATLVIIIPLQLPHLTHPSLLLSSLSNLTNLPLLAIFIILVTQPHP